MGRPKSKPASTTSDEVVDGEVQAVADDAVSIEVTTESDFPLSVILKNNTPSPLVFPGVSDHQIAPYESAIGTFRSFDHYTRFQSDVQQISELRGWADAVTITAA